LFFLAKLHAREKIEQVSCQHSSGKPAICSGICWAAYKLGPTEYRATLLARRFAGLKENYKGY
jgi:hypothetical protein